ncbi:hypothetical protein RJ640_008072 [Escallonia rubra]|uniref:Prolyl endopeptidase n=1 Tax=Escallonia rubra TaxID=112253 RepID=A0AA88UQB4_9ASTE|nr:hypothetical protein RJ640_008072 [Escallonia rubra]
MASLTILSFTRRSIRKSHLALTFKLIPNIPFSPFSSLCKTNPLPPPHDTSTSPPVPKKETFTVSAHGLSWNDPYHWMSNTKDPDFVEYLHKENAYAEAFMADTQEVQQTLYSEMTNRMPSKISTPPERWGPWLYYQYIPEGKEYPVLCRKLATQSGWMKTMLNYVREQFGPEEILLDWNGIAEQYGYVHVGTCRVSPDHNFLAYTLDLSGGERFVLKIKDLRSGCILPESRVEGVVSLAWAEDSWTLFYTVSDENQRPYRQSIFLVQSKKLRSDHVDDALIYIENDSSFCVDITSTKDGKFITVNSNSRTSSEEGHLCPVYVIDATSPQDGLRRFHKRVPGVQYFLEHHCGFFYVLTNLPLNDGKELPSGSYYLARCRDKDIRSDNWQNIILPCEDVSFQDMDIFNGHLVLFLNRKGSPLICSISMPIHDSFKKELEIDDVDPWYFPLPTSSCRVVPGSNHDFMNSVYRVVLSSPVIPDLIVDYDMSRKTFCIVQQEEVVGISSNAGSLSPNYEIETNELLHGKNDKDKDVHDSELDGRFNYSSEYCCKRHEVVGHDGVKIPMTILYSEKAHQKGQSPGLLIGYGAYGEALDKSWCPDRLSLLARGWVVAFADVRGGGGADPSWHRSGNGLQKLNSIHDFVSCANYLINEDYINRYQLGAFGHSAGSLLVAAAINMYPQLFRAVILKVPFLDICNTLLDTSLPLTILDFEEFGNPQLKSQFQAILSYSPYDNIHRGVCYPAMLVTASLHDSRVGVWEAAKWVAKVRESTCSSCSRTVILKTNMTGGHFGEGGRFGQCEETALEYAFLMKVMGISG